MQQVPKGVFCRNADIHLPIGERLPLAFFQNRERVEGNVTTRPFGESLKVCAALPQRFVQTGFQTLYLAVRVVGSAGYVVQLWWLLEILRNARPERFQNFYPFLVFGALYFLVDTVVEHGELPSKRGQFTRHSFNGFHMFRFGNTATAQDGECGDGFFYPRRDPVQESRQALCVGMLA